MHFDIIHVEKYSRALENSIISFNFQDFIDRGKNLAFVNIKYLKISK